jgi:hypothetical protein
MRMYWLLNHSSVRDTFPSLGLYAFASFLSRQVDQGLVRTDVSRCWRVQYPRRLLLSKIDQISHLKECSDRLTTFNDPICVLGTHIA